MERPQIRLVQDQQVEETIREVTGSEAEELLRKYGQGQDAQYTTRIEPQVPIQRELTFDEMIAQQEAKENDEKMRREQQMRGPKPRTFDGYDGYDSEVKYGSDDELGFGFKIEITTDMKIPRNY